MATNDEVLEALNEGIKTMANAVAKDPASVHAANYASAARQLAEAAAWLKVPAQPHGGASNTGG